MKAAAWAVLAAVGLGAVLVAAFGWGSLWVYVFVLFFVAALAVGLRQGGDVIQSWSRRRFDDRR